MRLALSGAVPKCTLSFLLLSRYSCSFRSATTRLLSQGAESLGRCSPNSSTHAACCHSCLRCTHHGTSGYGVKVSSQKCRCLSTDTSSESVSSTVSELYHQSPINKERGGTVMTEQLYSYLLAHTREPEVCLKLQRLTPDSGLLHIVQLCLTPAHTDTPAQRLSD